mgnify:CR=1 FL=1
MNRQFRSSRFDLDAAFKAFGAIAIVIAVVLSVAVVALTDPLGEYVTITPTAMASMLFAGLLVVTSYTAYTLRRR